MKDILVLGVSIGRCIKNSFEKITLRFSACKQLFGSIQAIALFSKPKRSSLESFGTCPTWGKGRERWRKALRLVPR